MTACEERADQPDVAVDSNGNSHIVYFDECGTSEREIFYSMLDSDGNILIDQTQLTADNTYSDKHPAVVIDSQDMVLVVCADRNYDTTNRTEILFMKIDPSLDDQDGSAADPATILVVDGAELTFEVDNWLTHPRLAIDSNDDIHVVFEEDGDQVYYLKADNNGNVLIPTIHIRVCSSWYGRPDVAIDSNDDVHIAWNDYDVTLDDEIYYMMLDGSDGSTLIDATLITPDDDLKSKRQTIQVDSQDKVHIVWQDQRGDQTEIYYTKLDPSLDDQSGDAADGAAITLIDDTALTPDDDVTSKNPQTAFLNDYIFISYYQDSVDGFDVYFMATDADGVIVEPSTALTSSGSVTYSTSQGDNAPNLDFGPDGKARVVWCDDRDGFYEIYCTSFAMVYVPVFLSSFQLQPDGASVFAAWQVDGDYQTVDFRLEGSNDQTQWEIPCQQIAPGQFVAEDNSAALAEGGEFFYRLYFRSDGVNWLVLGTETVTLTSVPHRTRIDEIFPNPFNPSTTVSFSVDRTRQIRIAVYNLAGEQIVKLADQVFEAGPHSVVWDGTDVSGRVVATGVYFCRLEAENEIDAKSVMMIK